MTAPAPQPELVGPAMPAGDATARQSTAGPAGPTRRPGVSGDRMAAVLLALCAVAVLGLVLAILVQLTYHSTPALRHFGWRFLWNDNWDPNAGDFGALTSIVGTLVTTAIAMLVATPVALAIALFLVELAPPKLSALVGGAIELLAAIPSIIYGMWGLFVFAPYIAQYIEKPLKGLAPKFPLFGGPPISIGVLSASLILALMVLPFMTAITRDVLRMVPPMLRESAYGMGATTWEVTRRVTVPYGLRGVVGAGFLALGRALGETMAVTFVIGNQHQLSASLFAPGSTIASTLANEFSEASEPLYVSSLIALALVLFAISLVVQLAAYGWLAWVSRSTKGVA